VARFASFAGFEGIDPASGTDAGRARGFGEHCSPPGARDGLAGPSPGDSRSPVTGKQVAGAPAALP
jgi:hypothetical protein